MLQAVVDRMSANSFQLRGWSVVLVSAMFALAASGSQVRFVYLAYFPAIAFWVLDGYYLHQERLFRKLYDHVRGLDASSIDFSMDASPFAGDVDFWRDVCFSTTLIVFHGAVVLLIVFLMVTHLMFA